MSAALPRRSFPAWLAPLIVVIGIIVAGVVVILLARRAGAPDVPPQPPEFVRPGPARPVTTLDVQQAGGGKLTLSDGSRDVALKPDARVEALRPITVDDIRIGDWLAAIGIPNEVRNFSIRSLVVIDSREAPDGEGVVRSPGGFAGHEASRDQNERPLLGGRVTDVTGTRVTIEGPVGPIAVDLTNRAPLYRLTSAENGTISEGDRVAFAGDSPTDADAVLVLSGGAR